MIVISYVSIQEILKRISPLMRPVRGVLGRATMGKTAEGRSELAELADDSASSADATIN